MTENRLITAISLTLALQIGVQQSAAQQEIYVTGLTQNGPHSYYSYPVVGFAFTPNKDITVGALGVFDLFGNGLYASFDVGIWDKQTQALLVQTKIQGGSSSALNEGFRWEAIPPLTLRAGTSYVVASYDGVDYEFIGVIHNSLLTHPDLSLEEGFLQDFQQGLSFPTRQGGPGFIFLGPNIATSVPLVFRDSEMAICINGKSNSTFRVEYSSELATSSWLPLAECLSGEGIECCILDKVPPGRARRFYRALTTDDASLSRISIRPSEIEICWSSQVGQLYEVDYWSPPRTNFWIPVSTNIPAAGLTTCAYDIIPVDAPPRYYRAVLMPR